MTDTLRASRPISYGTVVGNKLVRLFGFSGFERCDDGLYRFEGKFVPSRAIVQVQVANPWATELTTVEVDLCITHTAENYSGGCPDDDDGCRRVKTIVPGPRWRPVVSALGLDKFYVNTWRAPLAPEDGTAAVGDSVRADVDFFVMVMEV